MSLESIPFPAKPNQFQVFPLGLGNSISEAFVKVVAKADISLISNTLTIFLRQSLNSSEMDLVKMVIANNCAFQINLLDRHGSNGFLSVAFYTVDSNIINHSLSLDYSQSDGFLLHKLIIGFKKLEKGEGPYVTGGEPNTGMVSVDPAFPDVTNIDLDSVLTLTTEMYMNNNLRQDSDC